MWHSLNREIGRSQQELTDALQRMGGQALIGALQGIADQLPRTIAEMIEGVNTSALSTEGAAQIVQQIKQVAGAVAEFGKVAEALPFEDLRDLGFDAAAALLEANGGLEKFAGTVADVQELFMSDADIKAMKAGRIAAQFNAATGASVDADFVLGLSREEFRGYFMEFFAAGNTVVTQAMLDVAELFASITPEIDAAAEALRALQAKGRSLDVQILEAMGDTAGARQLLRAIETADMTPAQIAQYDINRGMQDQLDAIRKQAAIDGQVLDFQIRYYQLLGDETKARELLLSKMDPALQEWQKQIWALEDAAEAERKRTAAMEEQRRAAEALRQQWANLTDSMIEEARRLRGLVAGTTPGASLAYLQAQFAMANAAARAGDTTAAGRLPGLSQAVEQAALLSARSLPELNTIRSQLATSLESTAAARGNTDGSAAIVSELQQMRAENKELRTELKDVNAKLERHQRNTADVLDKWDKIGLPATQS